MHRALKPIWVLLALVFLFEAWLWSHLAPLVAWIVDRLALPALKARAAAWIERLPPWATLLVFLVPPILLLPLKFVGLWLVAHGSYLGAMAVLAAAKVVSMGVTAFIFEVTRPKLLQLAWFAWLYGRVLTGLAWAHRQVDPIKARMRAFALETLAPLRRRMRALARLLGPGRRGRFLRRLIRIRRRMQA
jgi:hypothetical protein